MRTEQLVLGKDDGTLRTRDGKVADACKKAPTTFPGCETPMDYAESHSHVMASVADLHIVCFDQAWAKDGHVLLRYTAEGSHCGEPHNGIEKTGKKAKWGAAAIFEIEDGKVKSFTKDWDKKRKQILWRIFDTQSDNGLDRHVRTARVAKQGRRVHLERFQTRRQKAQAAR